MDLPPKYLANLSPQQKLIQARLIQQSKKTYEKTGKVIPRPPVSSKTPPRSIHSKRFQDRFGFPITDKKKVQSTFPDTNIDGILDKGLAAYASSGSRPNVSPYAWAYARLASALTGGKAFKIDKDLIGKKSQDIIFHKD